MRVLVTGATGFIGRRLIEGLKGYDVIGLARRPLDIASVEWLEADLSLSSFVERLPPGVDAVVHAAQSPLYRQFPVAAGDMFAVNIAATQHLLNWSAANGVEAFIYLSSGSVYEPYDDPLVEDAALTPTSYYSVSKLGGELLASAYSSLLRCVSLRLFFPYGSGQKDRLIPSLIQRVREGCPIELAGEDGMVIAPVHVDDVVAVIRVALENPVMQGPINLGGPSGLSLREIGVHISRMLGTSVCFEQRPGDAPRIVPDLRRLRRFIDLGRFRSFSQGLEEMLAKRGTAGDSMEPC